MTIRHANTMLALLALLIGGCAKMTVKVNILNRDFFDSTRFLAAEVQSTEKKVETRFAGNWFARTQQRIDRIIDKWKDPMIPKGELEKKLKAQIKATVALQFDRATTLYREGINATEAARAIPVEKNNEDVRRAAYQQAAAKFRAADLELLKMPKLVGQAKADGASAADPAADATAPPDENRAPLAQEVHAAVEGLIGSHGLIDDAQAGLIVTAPNSMWKGEFNKAFGLGGLGNTDIAVVMQSLGDFTLKGVRVDATKVTKAAFDSIETGIKMVAAAYGVPLGAAGSSDGEASTATGPDDSGLRAADKAKADAEAKLKRQQAAYADIMRAIVREKSNLANDKAGAIKRMKSSFDSNTSLFTAGSTDGG